MGLLPKGDSNRIDPCDKQAYTKLKQLQKEREEKAKAAKAYSPAHFK